MNKYYFCWTLIGLFFISGIICHILSARAQAKCHHNWVWNQNIEGYWCEKCWKKK